MFSQVALIFISHSFGRNVKGQIPTSQATTLQDTSTFYPLHNWHLVGRLLKDSQFTFDFQILTLKKKKKKVGTAVFRTKTFPVTIIPVRGRISGQCQQSGQGAPCPGHSLAPKQCLFPQGAWPSPYLPDSSHPDSHYCICTSQIMLNVITMDFLVFRKPAGGEKRQMGKSWVKSVVFSDFH